MTKIQELYKELNKYYKFNEKDDTEKFLETVDKIILLKDPFSIGVLLKYFDDSSNYNWVLESVMIALEDFPSKRKRATQALFHSLFVRELYKRLHASHASCGVEF